MGHWENDAVVCVDGEMIGDKKCEKVNFAEGHMSWSGHIVGGISVSTCTPLCNLWLFRIGCGVKPPLSFLHGYKHSCYKDQGFNNPITRYIAGAPVTAPLNTASPPEFSSNVSTNSIHDWSSMCFFLILHSMFSSFSPTVSFPQL